MAENFKTVTLRLSPEQHRDLKLASFQAGKSLKDLLLDAAEHVRKQYAEEIEEAKKHK